MIKLQDYFEAFAIISKAHKEGKIDDEYFEKTQNEVHDIFKSIPTMGVSFKDKSGSKLSLLEMIEAVVENSNVQHYTDVMFFDDKGRLLIIQRSQNDDFQAGKWALPGGKLEEGESIFQSAQREAMEEVGVYLSISNCHYKGVIKNEDGSFSHYLCCYCDMPIVPMLDSEEIQSYDLIKLDKESLEKYDFMLDIKDRIKKFNYIPTEVKVTEQQIGALAKELLKD